MSAMSFSVHPPLPNCLSVGFFCKEGRSKGGTRERENMIDPTRARRRKSIKARSAKMGVLTAKSEQFSRERDAAGGMTAALEYQQAQLLRELRAADSGMEGDRSETIRV